MTILRPDTDLSDIFGRGFCFHCGGSVEKDAPSVLWNGYNERHRDESTALLMHPRCALAFGLRFMRDLHELDLDESLSRPLRRDASTPVGGHADEDLYCCVECGGPAAEGTFWGGKSWHPGDGLAGPFCYRHWGEFLEERLHAIHAAERGAA